MKLIVTRETCMPDLDPEVAEVILGNIPLNLTIVYSSRYEYGVTQIVSEAWAIVDPVEGGISEAWANKFGYDSQVLHSRHGDGYALGGMFFLGSDTDDVQLSALLGAWAVETIRQYPGLEVKFSDTVTEYEDNTWNAEVQGTWPKVTVVAESDCGEVE